MREYPQVGREHHTWFAHFSRAHREFVPDRTVGLRTKAVHSRDVIKGHNRLGHNGILDGSGQSVDVFIT